MLPVPACGSKTRRWHSHRSACSAVAPGGRTPNRNRGRPCSWPSGRSPRPPPPQSALSVFAAATRPPTAASGSQSSDRSVENCSLPGYHQGASRWRYSTPANPIKSDRLLGSVDVLTAVLMGIGGVLFTVGIGFHVWRALRFHNAIWHSFVLAAASCQYAAILHGVVLAG